MPPKTDPHNTSTNASESGRRPRVLMLTHRVPHPPDRGDRIRAYHLLRELSGRFDVTLAAIADEPIAQHTRDELARLTAETLLVKAKPMQRRALAAKALITGRPITPAAMLDRSLARRLVALHRDKPFDTVLTYCTGMVGYVAHLLADPDAQPFRHVLDLVDVDSVKWSRYAESARGPMRLVYAAEARRLREVEAGRVVPFDCVTVISEAERDRYCQQVRAEIEPVVVGNGVDLERFKPADSSGETGPVIVFTGVMSYRPNIEAVTWFARRVMPRVLAAVPDARLDIVGKSPTPAVRVLDELPGVRVVGPVVDTADHLRDAALAVAPLKIAPGVQNKVLEAMACGLAVVCSSAAAAGIDAQRGRHLFVADDETDTAARCAQLLLSPDERAAIGRRARQRVQERYRWPRTLAPMLTLIDPARRTTPASPS